ncbi:tetratricopeptide repeat protein [Pedobacter insulae]|uniref:Tetratricopeptide repeat-containing protein n=1 Tax=Pedobacter insulae TaxID=414048 RepID=A0A1I3AJE7_9SPHI|nr:tetratricopeptide repeat protein [Pedobacter insulae]SFH50197.1 Tetratricopeptide repeat-containing protein [Pedobacter insulae]
MKKIFFSMLFVGISSYANAQKAELAEAKKIWGIFELTMSVDPAKKEGAKAPAADAKAGTFVDRQIAKLNEGLSHIDKATAHDKTKDLPETWVYKALFHSTLAAVDTLNIENSIKNQKAAEEAIAKTKSLDTKNDQKDFVAQAESNIQVALSARGIMAYNKKDYATALDYFSQIAAKNPTDPSWFLNAGVAANLLGKYPEAIQNFKKVISLNSPDAKNLYSQIINITIEKLKDTTTAIALLDEAIAKFPDDSDLIGTQTDLYIATGDVVKSQASLTKLIAKDSSKPVYQYLMGETYYKQALQMQEQRNKIDSKKVKEFDAITAKMVALIDQALPYYKKSIELDPKFVPALETLKQIYGFKNDTENFNDVKKKLDALPQN